MRLILPLQIFAPLLLSVLLCLEPASAQQTKNYQVEVKIGLNADGSITRDWYEAINDRIPASDSDRIRTTWRPLSDGERRWLELIENGAEKWSQRRATLDVPFEGIRLSRKIFILVGNQIGDDGFTYRNDTICVDIGAMWRNYGEAGTPGNEARLIRLLDHEYTHLLHHEWIRRNPIKMSTPYDRALRDLIVEGIGNYRSLSDKWVDVKGKLTPLATETLSELQPIFVDRVTKLRVANEDAEEQLRRGLSRGPFAKKWGALTVALWLAKETGGDDRKLARWVRRGPPGIVVLARKHLPVDLRKKFLATD